MLVETGEGCIDHILSGHHDLARQVLYRTTGLCPEWRCSCAGQHNLNSDACAFQFVLQRLRKVHDIRLGAAVCAVQKVGRKSNDGGNVDQQTVLACHKTRQGGKGQPRQSGDIQIDYRFEIVDVRIEKFPCAAEAGVVYQRSDCGVGAQTLGDAANIFRLRQVGSDRFDSATGGLQSCGNFREILLAASHENEIVTALGKAICVDCADAGGSTSDKSGAFGCGC